MGPVPGAGHDASRRAVSPQELYRLVNLYDAPPWVKDAAADRLCGAPDLPAHCYADAGRDYPVHTAPATWLSAARHLDAAGDVAYAHRGDRIKAAAVHWGIVGEYAKIAAAAAAARDDGLAALPDDAFALVQGEGDAKTRDLPLRHPAEVKDAAAWLVRHRDEFLPADRRVIAGRVLEKAAAAGVAADDLAVLARAAGRGNCATKHAVEAIVARGAWLRGVDNAAADRLAELCDAVAAAGVADDPGLRLKLAAALDAVDRATGLCRQYGAGLPRPDDVLFAVPARSAAELVAVVADRLTPFAKVASGDVYRRDDLARVSPATLRDAMGDAFADAVSDDGVFVDADKLAAALADSPEDAELFVRTAAAMGVVPLWGEPVGRRGVDLMRLAAG